MTNGIRTEPRFHLGHPESHIPKFEAPGVASRMAPARWILVTGGVGLVLAFAAEWFHKVGEAAAAPSPRAVWLLPLAVLLLAIAAMPFVARHFWEKHYHHVAVALAAIVALYYLVVLRAGDALAKGLAEYLSFIFLVGSLFIVSGGILIRVRRTATPGVNAAFLLSGALLANVLGTTGAAMLLIRPYLRMNRGHLRAYHVVFFIFLVANVGGCLTPIGDPPLFLGHLKGIPFWWFAQVCWPMWVMAVGILLLVFLGFEMWSLRGEKRAVHKSGDLAPAVSIYGAVNLLLIVAIVAGLLLHETLQHQVMELPWREMVMVLAACASLWVTPHKIHEENVFNFAPIREIAYLFLGIFCTMVPVLNYMEQHGRKMEELLKTPGQEYFACGGLSSVLDNAPTFLAFLEMQFLRAGTGTGVEGKGLPVILADAYLTKGLLAISLASVFFGAMTYIGNGPNFMVKSIAEHDQAACPSFFGYILKYALPILLPVLVAVWWVFLR